MMQYSTLPLTDIERMTFVLLYPRSVLALEVIAPCLIRYYIANRGQLIKDTDLLVWLGHKNERE
jgi:hypothetical protein